MTDEERRIRLQALQNLRDKRLDEAQKARISTPDRSLNLAKGQLDKDVYKVSGASMNPNVGPDRTRMNVGTERINTKQIEKIEDADIAATIREQPGLRKRLAQARKSGDDVMVNKIKQVAKGLGKGVRAIPGIGGVVGGIAAAMGSEDASAAVPILGEAESVGMSPVEEDMFIAERQAQKDYGQSPAARDRARALARLAKLQE